MKVNVRVLIRRIKRSIRKNQEVWIKGGILAAILLVIIVFAGSCACARKNSGAKEPDAASMGVMKITPIPSPTPTEVPREVNKDAVAQSGNVTMVNEYLVQKEAEGGTADTSTQAASDNSGEEDTSEGENQDGTE